MKQNMKIYHAYFDFCELYRSFMRIGTPIISMLIHILCFEAFVPLVF